MFAAVLVICSLTSPKCSAVALDHYATRQECVDQTVQFAKQHAAEIASVFGKFDVAVWRRAPKGGKAA